MLSGRHFVLLGILACAGLVSVHDGQRQVDLCYKIAALEKDMRGVRSQIELCKIKHLALQSPHAVMTRAADLQLKVAPLGPSSPTAESEIKIVTAATAMHSLGSAQGAHPPHPAQPAHGH